MTRPPPSAAGPADPPAPATRPSPKRGAFPSPRADIEKATPYVPGAAPPPPSPQADPSPPTDVGGNKKGD
jgi:hypothetical protein